MYVLTLVDTYGPPVCLLVLGLSEVLVVAWIYGKSNILKCNTVNLRSYDITLSNHHF